MGRYCEIIVLLFYIYLRHVNANFLLSHENPCDYCDTHIACNNDLLFSKKCYPNVKILVMTNEMRNFILDKHNYYRNRLASGLVPGFKPAIRMASQYWNYEFEYLSALNLLQCFMAHDKCRRTPNYPYVGQNLAFLKWRGYNFTTEQVVERLIGHWFQEYENTTMNDITNLPPRDQSLPLIGHFTLMAQERANQVGCSILHQKSTDNVDEIYVACDYSFTNIYTVQVYRSGKPASACRTGVNPEYKSLCSLKEPYSTSTHLY